MTDHDTFDHDALIGWDDELTDWTDAARTSAYRCETGGCLRVETDGDSTVLYESAQPGIKVVTSTASWQSWLDGAKAEERAAIVAGLRDYGTNLAESDVETLNDFADLIERGEFDGLVAGDE